jgi:tRNA threonylcarbamoyladenosine biosynthesis protein TsaE
MQRVIDLPNEQTSEQIAKLMANCLVSPLVMTFSGEIGAGKTTLIRAMLRHLGVTSAIKSPTFSLIESYSLSNLQIHHFDLYRINEEIELDYIGFRDYFSHNAVCCIEWPERAPNSIESIDIAFSLKIKGAGREIHAHAFSSAAITMLTCITGEL